MKRALCLSIFAFVFFSCGQHEQQAVDYLKLHTEALVIDLHSDSAMRMMDGIDFALRDSTGHMDIPRLLEGGVDLQVLACWLATETPLEECRPHVDSMIDSIQAQIARNSDRVEICLTAAESERIINDGKIAIFIGIENGVAIANDLENIRHFYDRGARYLTLCHTASNDWCISSADTLPAFDGLTDFGRDVVRKMNELGMIIDISHLHPTAVAAVLEVTTDPVIASHSCVKSLCDHDRNLTDDQIKAVAKNGGVIGINFYRGYLSDEWSKTSDSVFECHRAVYDSIKALYPDDKAKRRLELRPFFKKFDSEMKKTGIDVDVSTVVDHIDHVVKLVGPDYVCFGSDFDGIPSLPTGLEDCSGMPNITKELVVRGYSETDIRKILGENFMRVFAQVCDN